MQIALAPMEGLVDDILRNVLTKVGGIDWCVTEFIRVSERLMPAHYFYKYASEFHQGAKTDAGTPLRLQLLGSDPVCLAENAAFACELGAPVLDLNFGCPAKTVNRSRGGAILLKEPELLHSIVSQVRRAVPKHIPVTAKMRLGYENTDGALDCARALADGGQSKSSFTPAPRLTATSLRRTGSGSRAFRKWSRFRWSPTGKSGPLTIGAVAAKSVARGTS